MAYNVSESVVKTTATQTTINTPIAIRLENLATFHILGYSDLS
jgi:hypothetical protein